MSRRNHEINRSSLPGNDERQQVRFRVGPQLHHPEGRKSCRFEESSNPTLAHVPGPTTDRQIAARQVVMGVARVNRASKAPPVMWAGGIHSGRNSTRFRISACVMTDAMRARSRTAPPTVTRSWWP